MLLTAGYHIWGSLSIVLVCCGLYWKRGPIIWSRLYNASHLVLKFYTYKKRERRGYHPNNNPPWELEEASVILVFNPPSFPTTVFEKEHTMPPPPPPTTTSAVRGTSPLPASKHPLPICSIPCRTTSSFLFSLNSAQPLPPPPSSSISC